MMKIKKKNGYYEIFTTDKKTYEKSSWVVFRWGGGFELTYEVCGYFDNRPRINLNLIFFSITLVVPFRNKWTDECHAPKWGISIHNESVWIYRGGKGNDNGGNKWWTWDIPFISRNWVRTSILLKDNTWEHETEASKKSFWKDEWKQKQEVWNYDYVDSYDNEVIPTKIYVEEMEWRPKWLQWTSLFSKVRTTIDVHFSKGCGSRKGSWKGGVIGCSYNLLQNESPIDCIKRMEKERIL